MTHEIKVIQPKKVSIKDDPILSEAWLQEAIATDPSTANWVWEVGIRGKALTKERGLIYVDCIDN